MLLNYTAEASAGSNSNSLCCHTCFTASTHTHTLHSIIGFSSIAFPSAASLMSQVLQRGKFHFLPSPRVTSQLTTNCSYATLAGDTRTTRQPPTSYSCSSSLLFSLPLLAHCQVLTFALIIRIVTPTSRCRCRCPCQRPRLLQVFTELSFKFLLNTLRIFVRNVPPLSSLSSRLLPRFVYLPAVPAYVEATVISF